MAIPDSIPVQYGPRKLGMAEWKRQQALSTLKKREATAYGHRKSAASPAAPDPVDAGAELAREIELAHEVESGLGDIEGKEDAINPFLPTGDSDASRYVTLAELEEKLTEQPELLDFAIQAEFRAGKPRVGAVKLFRRLEEARVGGARPGMMKLLLGHS